MSQDAILSVLNIWRRGQLVCRVRSDVIDVATV